MRMDVEALAMIGVISYGAGQGVTAQNMLQMGDRGE